MSRRDDSLDQRFIELYRSGMSDKAAAAAVGKGEHWGELVRKRHGIPANPPRMGHAHPLFKGEAAGYSAFHNRVTRRRGQPKHCEQCGTTDPMKRYEWANLTGNYGDADDYQRMCKKCHNDFDRRLPPTCGYGHEFTPENTYTHPQRGTRQCRECTRRRQQSYSNRKASA